MSFGGTIAALSGKDFVVIGATKGVSLAGMLIISRHGGKRVFSIDDRILIGYTGLYASFQHVQRLVELELRREKYAYGLTPTVKRVTNILSNILFSGRYQFPSLIEALVGGFNPDGSGPELYVLGPVGEVNEEKYAAAGDGFEVALSVLEADYKENISLEEGIKLVKKALRSAARLVASNYPDEEPDVEYVKRRFFERESYWSDFSLSFTSLDDRRDRGVTR